LDNSSLMACPRTLYFSNRIAAGDHFESVVEFHERAIHRATRDDFAALAVPFGQSRLPVPDTEGFSGRVDLSHM
jgi:hypothetical protein